MHCRFFPLTALFGAMMLANVSFAADMPVKAAPLTAIPNWSGAYFGINGGYGFGSSTWTNQTSAPGATFYDSLPGDTFGADMRGAIGGVQLGYNIQRGPWVYGLETTFDASALKADNLSTFGAADDQFEARIKALFTATGRLGYAVDRMLVYGKAGVAFANVKVSVTDNVAPTTGSGSDSEWLAGPTVGIGLEYAVTPRLSFGVEYNYIRLPSASYELGGGVGTYSWNVEARDISLVLARLSYKFDLPR